MNDDQFWAIIDKSSTAAGGDAENQPSYIETLLRELPPAEIVAFDRKFSDLHNQAYTWPLWGAAYVIGGGCSDDGFMDFRGWLISRGRHVYEAAIADPDSLAIHISDGEETQVEGFQYAAKQAWATVMGKEYRDFPRHDIAYRSEPEGDAWEEDDLPGLFPRLAEKFE